VIGATRSAQHELAGGLYLMSEDRSRGRGLLEDVRAQNSHLRQLIDATYRLVARSQALLHSLRSPGKPGNDEKRPPE